MHSPVSYAAIVCATIAEIFAIASALTPFWQNSEIGITREYFYFQTVTVAGGYFESTTDYCNALSGTPDHDGAACNQFRAGQGLIISACVFGALAILGFILVALRGVENKLFIAIAAFFTFLLALFEFVVMCLSVNFRHWQFQDGVWYGTGFVLCILSWIMAVIALLTTPLHYRHRLNTKR